MEIDKSTQDKMERIFHNKLVHYNPIQFPNGMKKSFYRAMDEYCNLEVAKVKKENKVYQDRVNDFISLVLNSYKLTNDKTPPEKVLMILQNRANDLINLNNGN